MGLGLGLGVGVGRSHAYATSKETPLYWRHNPAPQETASIGITHQSLPPTRLVHRCSAGQKESQLVATQPAPHGTARCSAGQQEGQPTATPTPLLRANGSTASQLTRGKLRPASSRHARLPSANRYALRPFSWPKNSATNWLRHNCPFQGQQTVQQASWHYENFARLPWSSVTLIVNICYSGCLRTRVRHPTVTNTIIFNYIHKMCTCHSIKYTTIKMRYNTSNPHTKFLLLEKALFPKL
jgi:hypothetical protein